MEINRLFQEELAFEMAVRGLPTTSVDGMRKSLRATRTLGREGSVKTGAEYPFTFEEDSKAVKSKIGMVEEHLKGNPTDPKSSDYLKIVTKIDWAVGRIDRSQAGEKEEKR